MMVWIFKKMGLSVSRTSELIEKITRIRMIFSAVFYTLMVFIVIFGISGDVYAGFPQYVPYVIIAIFLFMAFIRMYQCMVDDSYIKMIVAKKTEGKEKKDKKDKASDTKDAIPADEIGKPGASGQENDSHDKN